MKKVGILGGTFSPPHNGHLIIANEVMSALELDEIWFMPNQVPPHKERPDTASNENRLEMLRLALEGNEKFKIETIEWQRSGASYTIDTMKILTDLYPGQHFYFIIGADMIEYLPKWHKIDELAELVNFVGVDRPSYSHETKYPITLVNIPVIDISSSLIRERLGNGKTVRYLLPDSVRQYIKENHLYGT
ncbi:nicotinate-nucleotide adenylyltransferase [Neobacillus terrae]|uniref:nicotinate-nucleotide adenylyltransferase n=1 Tax=Neobacillus terrae TaxID=3034837 RepID=UPI00140E2844|nr:nicotinate-nucleotide adenylyltransferase [Neobacillus terrae]